MQYKNNKNKKHYKNKINHRNMNDYYTDYTVKFNDNFHPFCVPNNDYIRNSWRSDLQHLWDNIVDISNYTNYNFYNAINEIRSMSYPYKYQPIYVCDSRCRNNYGNSYYPNTNNRYIDDFLFSLDELFNIVNNSFTSSELEPIKNIIIDFINSASSSFKHDGFNYSFLSEYSLIISKIISKIEESNVNSKETELVNKILNKAKNLLKKIVNNSEFNSGYPYNYPNDNDYFYNDFNNYDYNNNYNEPLYDYNFNRNGNLSNDNRIERFYNRVDFLNKDVAKQIHSFEQSIINIIDKEKENNDSKIEELKKYYDKKFIDQSDELNKLSNDNYKKIKDELIDFCNKNNDDLVKVFDEKLVVLENSIRLSFEEINKINEGIIDELIKTSNNFSNTVESIEYKINEIEKDVNDINIRYNDYNNEFNQRFDDLKKHYYSIVDDLKKKQELWLNNFQDLSKYKKMFHENIDKINDIANSEIKIGESIKQINDLYNLEEQLKNEIVKIYDKNNSLLQKIEFDKQELNSKIERLHSDIQEKLSEVYDKIENATDAKIQNLSDITNDKINKIYDDASKEFNQLVDKTLSMINDLKELNLNSNNEVKNIAENVAVEFYKYNTKISELEFEIKKQNFSSSESIIDDINILRNKNEDIEKEILLIRDQISINNESISDIESILKGQINELSSLTDADSSDFSISTEKLLTLLSNQQLIKKEIERLTNENKLLESKLTNEKEKIELSIKEFNEHVYSAIDDLGIKLSNDFDMKITWLSKSTDERFVQLEENIDKKLNSLYSDCLNLIKDLSENHEKEFNNVLTVIDSFNNEINKLNSKILELEFNFVKYMDENNENSSKILEKFDQIKTDNKNTNFELENIRSEWYENVQKLKSLEHLLLAQSKEINNLSSSSEETILISSDRIQELNDEEKKVFNEIQKILYVKNELERKLDTEKNLLEKRIKVAVQEVTSMIFDLDSKLDETSEFLSKKIDKSIESLSNDTIKIIEEINNETDNKFMTLFSEVEDKLSTIQKDTETLMDKISELTGDHYDYSMRQDIENLKLETAAISTNLSEFKYEFIDSQKKINEINENLFEHIDNIVSSNEKIFNSLSLLSNEAEKNTKKINFLNNLLESRSDELSDLIKFSSEGQPISSIRVDELLDNSKDLDDEVSILFYEKNRIRSEFEFYKNEIDKNINDLRKEIKEIKKIDSTDYDKFNLIFEDYINKTNDRISAISLENKTVIDSINSKIDDKFSQLYSDTLDLIESVKIDIEQNNDKIALVSEALKNEILKINTELSELEFDVTKQLLSNNDFDNDLVFNSIDKFKLMNSEISAQFEEIQNGIFLNAQKFEALKNLLETKSKEVDALSKLNDKNEFYGYENRVDELIENNATFKDKINELVNERKNLLVLFDEYKSIMDDNFKSFVSEISNNMANDKKELITSTENLISEFQSNIFKYVKKIENDNFELIKNIDLSLNARIDELQSENANLLSLLTDSDINDTQSWINNIKSEILFLNTKLSEIKNDAIENNIINSSSIENNEIFELLKGFSNENLIINKQLENINNCIGANDKKIKFIENLLLNQSNELSKLSNFTNQDVYQSEFRVSELIKKIDKEKNEINDLIAEREIIVDDLNAKIAAIENHIDNLNKNLNSNYSKDNEQIINDVESLLSDFSDVVNNRISNLETETNVRFEKFDSDLNEKLSNMYANIIEMIETLSTQFSDHVHNDFLTNSELIKNEILAINTKLSSLEFYSSFDGEVTPDQAKINNEIFRLINEFKEKNNLFEEEIKDIINSYIANNNKADSLLEFISNQSKELEEYSSYSNDAFNLSQDRIGALIEGEKELRNKINNINNEKNNIYELFEKQKAELQLEIANLSKKLYEVVKNESNDIIKKTDVLLLNLSNSIDNKISNISKDNDNKIKELKEDIEEKLFVMYDHIITLIENIQNDFANDTSNILALNDNLKNLILNFDTNLSKFEFDINDSTIKSTINDDLIRFVEEFKNINNVIYEKIDILDEFAKINAEKIKKIEEVLINQSNELKSLALSSNDAINLSFDRIQELLDSDLSIREEIKELFNEKEMILQAFNLQKEIVNDNIELIKNNFESITKSSDIEVENHIKEMLNDFSAEMTEKINNLENITNEKIENINSNFDDKISYLFDHTLNMIEKINGDNELANKNIDSLISLFKSEISESNLKLTNLKIEIANELANDQDQINDKIFEIIDNLKNSLQVSDNKISLHQEELLSNNKKIYSLEQLLEAQSNELRYLSNSANDGLLSSYSRIEELSNQNSFIEKKINDLFANQSNIINDFNQEKQLLNQQIVNAKNSLDLILKDYSDSFASKIDEILSEMLDTINTQITQVNDNANIIYNEIQDNFNEQISTLYSTMLEIIDTLKQKFDDDISSTLHFNYEFQNNMFEIVEKISHFEFSFINDFAANQTVINNKIFNLLDSFRSNTSGLNSNISKINDALLSNAKKSRILQDLLVLQSNEIKEFSKSVLFSSDASLALINETIESNERIKSKINDLENEKNLIFNELKNQKENFLEKIYELKQQVNEISDFDKNVSDELFEFIFALEDSINKKIDIENIKNLEIIHAHDEQLYQNLKNIRNEINELFSSYKLDLDHKINDLSDSINFEINNEILKINSLLSNIKIEFLNSNNSQKEFNDLIYEIIDNFKDSINAINNNLNYSNESLINNDKKINAISNLLVMLSDEVKNLCNAAEVGFSFSIENIEKLNENKNYISEKLNKFISEKNFIIENIKNQKNEFYELVNTTKLDLEGLIDISNKYLVDETINLLNNLTSSIDERIENKYVSLDEKYQKLSDQLDDKLKLVNEKIIDIESEINDKLENQYEIISQSNNIIKNELLEINSRLSSIKIDIFEHVRKVQDENNSNIMSLIDKFREKNEMIIGKILDLDQFINSNNEKIILIQSLMVDQSNELRSFTKSTSHGLALFSQRIDDILDNNKHIEQEVKNLNFEKNRIYNEILKYRDEINSNIKTLQLDFDFEIKNSCDEIHDSIKGSLLEISQNFNERIINSENELNLKITQVNSFLLDKVNVLSEKLNSLDFEIIEKLKNDYQSLINDNKEFKNELLETNNKLNNLEVNILNELVLKQEQINEEFFSVIKEFKQKNNSILERMSLIDKSTIDNSNLIKLIQSLMIDQSNELKSFVNAVWCSFDASSSRVDELIESSEVIKNQVDELTRQKINALNEIDIFRNEVIFNIQSLQTYIESVDSSVYHSKELDAIINNLEFSLNDKISDFKLEVDHRFEEINISVEDKISNLYSETNKLVSELKDTLYKEYNELSESNNLIKNELLDINSMLSDIEMDLINEAVNNQKAINEELFNAINNFKNNNKKIIKEVNDINLFANNNAKKINLIQSLMIDQSNELKSFSDSVLLATANSSEKIDQLVNFNDIVKKQISELYVQKNQILEDLNLQKEAISDNVNTLKKEIERLDVQQDQINDVSNMITTLEENLGSEIGNLRFEFNDKIDDINKSIEERLVVSYTETIKLIDELKSVLINDYEALNQSNDLIKNKLLDVNNKLNRLEVNSINDAILNQEQINTELFNAINEFKQKNNSIVEKINAIDSTILGNNKKINLIQSLMIDQSNELKAFSDSVASTTEVSNDKIDQLLNFNENIRKQVNELYLQKDQIVDDLNLQKEEISSNIIELRKILEELDLKKEEIKNISNLIDNLEETFGKQINEIKYDIDTKLSDFDSSINEKIVSSYAETLKIIDELKNSLIDDYKDISISNDEVKNKLLNINVRLSKVEADLLDKILVDQDQINSDLFSVIDEFKEKNNLIMKKIDTLDSSVLNNNKKINLIQSLMIDQSNELKLFANSVSSSYNESSYYIDNLLNSNDDLKKKINDLINQKESINNEINLQKDLINDNIVSLKEKFDSLQLGKDDLKMVASAINDLDQFISEKVDVIKSDLDDKFVDLSLEINEKISNLENETKKIIDDLDQKIINDYEKLTYSNDAIRDELLEINTKINQIEIENISQSIANQEKINSDLFNKLNEFKEKNNLIIKKMNNLGSSTKDNYKRINLIQSLMVDQSNELKLFADLLSKGIINSDNKIEELFRINDSLRKQILDLNDQKKQIYDDLNSCKDLISNNINSLNNSSIDSDNLEKINQIVSTMEDLINTKMNDLEINVENKIKEVDSSLNDKLKRTYDDLIANINNLQQDNELSYEKDSINNLLNSINELDKRLIDLENKKFDDIFDINLISDTKIVDAIDKFRNENKIILNKINIINDDLEENNKKIKLIEEILVISSNELNDMSKFDLKNIDNIIEKINLINKNKEEIEKNISALLDQKSNLHQILENEKEIIENNLKNFVIELLDTNNGKEINEEFNDIINDFASQLEIKIDSIKQDVIKDVDEKIDNFIESESFKLNSLYKTINDIINNLHSKELICTNNFVESSNTLNDKIDETKKYLKEVSKQIENNSETNVKDLKNEINLINQQVNDISDFVYNTNKEWVENSKKLEVIENLLILHSKELNDAKESNSKNIDDIISKIDNLFQGESNIKNQIDKIIDGNIELNKQIILQKLNFEEELSKSKEAIDKHINDILKETESNNLSIFNLLQNIIRDITNSNNETLHLINKVNYLSQKYEEFSKLNNDNEEIKKIIDDYQSNSALSEKVNSLYNMYVTNNDKIEILENKLNDFNELMLSNDKLFENNNTNEILENEINELKNTNNNITNEIIDLKNEFNEKIKVVTTDINTLLDDFERKWKDEFDIDLLTDKILSSENLDLFLNDKIKSYINEELYKLPFFSELKLVKKDLDNLHLKIDNFSINDLISVDSNSSDFLLLVLEIEDKIKSVINLISIVNNEDFKDLYKNIHEDLIDVENDTNLVRYKVTNLINKKNYNLKKIENLKMILNNQTEKFSNSNLSDNEKQVIISKYNAIFDSEFNKIYSENLDLDKNLKEIYENLKQKVDKLSYMLENIIKDINSKINFNILNARSDDINELINNSSNLSENELNDVINVYSLNKVNDEINKIKDLFDLDTNLISKNKINKWDLRSNSSNALSEFDADAIKKLIDENNKIRSLIDDDQLIIKESLKSELMDNINELEKELKNSLKKDLPDDFEIEKIVTKLLDVHNNKTKK